jgi:hypothetical protein
MKSILYLLMVNVICTGIFAQTFDDFTIDKEVSIFVKKEFKSLKNFELGIKCPEKENEFYLDSMEYSPWYVGDFNNDKMADLFFTGQEKKDQAHYLILGIDEYDELATYSLLPVYPYKNKGNLVIPFIEERRKEPLIIFRHFKTDVRTEMRNGKEVRVPRTYQDHFKLGLIKKDTLVYKFGGIVEYNLFAKPKDIRFIQFHAFCQYGVCQDFKLKIDSARNMILQNIKGTPEETGFYTSYCDQKLFTDIFDLCNYLKIDRPNQTYGNPSADKVYTMLIQYQDDSYATWYDYEGGASLAIRHLYELLLKAKHLSVWERYEVAQE